MLRLKTAQMDTKLVHLSWSITCRRARIVQMQPQMRIRRQAGRLGDEARLQSQSGRAFTWHGTELPKPTNHKSGSVEQWCIRISYDG